MLTGAHGDDELRRVALERLQHKEEFYAHLFAYLFVNGALIAIWAMTGSGFFWPIFPLLGWGIGLGFHAWDTFHRSEPTEKKLQREMAKLRHG